jgi:hypothetical protein
MSGERVLWELCRHGNVHAHGRYDWWDEPYEPDDLLPDETCDGGREVRLEEVDPFEVFTADDGQPGVRAISGKVWREVLDE